MTKTEQLTEMLKPAAEALGYEFLGIEYVGQGVHSVLRVYIDHENGIDVEDCSKVSHQVSGILEVEDPISSQYTLEVSSPGIDRPLFNLSHFQKVVGEIVNLKCHIGTDGRRKFKGPLLEIVKRGTADILVIEVDGNLYDVEYDDVDKANLVVKI